MNASYLFYLTTDGVHCCTRILWDEDQACNTLSGLSLDQLSAKLAAQGCTIAEDDFTIDASDDWREEAASASDSDFSGLLAHEWRFDPAPVEGIRYEFRSDVVAAELAASAERRQAEADAFKAQPQ